MRKILSLTVLSLLILSCSSDNTDVKEESLVLSSQEKTIMVGDTFTLQASASCVWDTERGYIADVDEGLVIAKHVGETEITATNGKGSSACRIIVKGKLNTYKEPILDFGASMSEVVEKESRTFSHQYGSESLTFDGENSIVDRVNYYFENDKLVQVDVVILHNYSSAVKNSVDKYLLERYEKSNGLNTQHSKMVWTNAYFMVNGYGDDYDVVVYHYPFASSFGSTANNWGDRRWSIIYTSKGRTPTTPAENM